MVFATDFDPNDFDSLAQTKQVRSGSSDNQGSRVKQMSDAVDAQAAIAAFKRDAEEAKRTDNVLSLHTDSATHGQKEASGKSVNIRRKPSLPLWLSVLTRVQQGSTVVTGLLMTGALVLYGSTVYVDRATSTALTQLDALQGESQELTAANEAIKQSLAEQAIREDSGLELREADDIIFVEPEPLREAVAQPEAATEEQLVPLGY